MAARRGPKLGGHVVEAAAAQLLHDLDARPEEPARKRVQRHIDGIVGLHQLDELGPPGMQRVSAEKRVSRCLWEGAGAKPKCPPIKI